MMKARNMMKARIMMKARSMFLTMVIGLVLPMTAQQNVSLDGEWNLTVDGKSYQVTVPHTYNIMEGLEDYAGEAVYQRASVYKICTRHPTDEPFRLYRQSPL